MTPEEYLEKLQSEAENGFHKELGAWVDPKSAIAKFVKAYTRDPLAHAWAEGWQAGMTDQFNHIEGEPFQGTPNPYDRDES